MSKVNIGCVIERLRYQYDGDVCDILVQQDACVDMQATIAYVTARFPDVQEIITRNGAFPDTVYSKEGGKWFVTDVKAELI